MRFLEREIVNGLSKPKTGIVSQSIQAGLDRWQQPAAFGKQQDTDAPHRLQTLVLGHTTPFFLIQQDQIGTQLKSLRPWSHMERICMLQKPWLD